MVESAKTGRDQWSAGAVMAIIEKAQNDKSFDRVAKWLDINLDQLQHTLEELDTI